MCLSRERKEQLSLHSDAQATSIMASKTGQGWFSRPKAKRHSMSHVHMAKFSFSQKRVASFRQSPGSSPWPVLSPEPCPAIVWEHVSWQEPKLCQGEGMPVHQHMPWPLAFPGKKAAVWMFPRFSPVFKSCFQVFYLPYGWG